MSLGDMDDVLAAATHATSGISFASGGSCYLDMRAWPPHSETGLPCLLFVAVKDVKLATNCSAMAVLVLAMDS